MATFKQRRGTAAALAAANETPAAGQIVVEMDTNRLKIGDGITPWNSLGYLNNDIVISDVTGLQSALDGKQPAGNYAPLVHQHVVGDFSGLQALLDAKAPVAHQHYVSDIVQLWDWLDTKVNVTDSRLTDQRVPTDGSVTFAKLSSTLKIDGGTVV